ncbi:MAG: ribosome recycling factor [Candidatus Magasanikbacteria bacterium]|nr:ribosome recycling factor [Candidatus Magasanikbacteria bacterium]
MNINIFKPEFDKSIEFLKTDIAGLRTGRANTVLVESITVEAYGSRQQLKSMASISVADSKTLNIEPWDKGLLAAIEKGIRDSGIGLNPVNDGRLIRISLPELTVERRAELAKVLHQKLESARISVKKIREEVKNMIVDEEKDKIISEDERYHLQEKLDEMVKKYNDDIKSIGENKEAEITNI